jgi:hypothetical protein
VANPLGKLAVINETITLDMRSDENWTDPLFSHAIGYGEELFGQGEQNGLMHYQSIVGASFILKYRSRREEDS